VYSSSAITSTHPSSLPVFFAVSSQSPFGSFEGLFRHARSCGIVKCRWRVQQDFRPSQSLPASPARSRRSIFAALSRHVSGQTAFRCLLPATKLVPLQRPYGGWLAP
jgi:hypothetical protein